MPHIFLDPDGSLALGLLLIVKASTGVIYEQQCGGFATERMSAEGFLIPVGAESEAKVISDWFWKTFNGHCYSGHKAWTSELVAELSGLVNKIPCWLTSASGDDHRYLLQLDATRIGECIEAWIPVISPYGPAILTLENSD